MQEKIKQLDLGASVLIPTIDLPKIFEYSMNQPGYRSFRYEYFKEMVEIKAVDIHIIIRHHEPN